MTYFAIFGAKKFQANLEVSEVLIISLRIGTKETHEILHFLVGFIGIVQSSHIFLNTIFNTCPFLYKF